MMCVLRRPNPPEAAIEQCITRGSAMHRFSRRWLSTLLLALLLPALPTAAAPSLSPSPSLPLSPSTSHPRLWITPDDLPRLRGWATDANPVYRDGLAVLAENMKADMDAGTVPGKDGGDPLWEEFPTESYAELFSFMSLIDPDEAARADYAQRARTLLMDVINEAAKGQAEETPFRAPDFATNDRSRWCGESYGLTVDWIYPVLLTADSPYTYHDYPSYSADGSHLVFDCGDRPYAAEGTAICEVVTDGSGFQVLLTPDANPDSSSSASPVARPQSLDEAALHGPAYAPDGSLVFEADWGSETIWRLPAGSNTPDSIGPAFNNDNAPCVLPDGRVASLWLDRPGGTSLHELKVMTSDGDSYVMLAINVDIVDIACGA
jgi:hypothetical protein